MEKQNKNWTKFLTPEQEGIMKVLGGNIANIESLFNILTKEMTQRNSYLCKLGYLETLAKVLKLKEEGDKIKDDV